ncbi:MAG TPA: hypothetical protein H9743_03130 [Candidatus Mediterraneibacter vanvlietii]|nr:hypothetical protein [Candidatus Mediterraneibacter vanvlietii]
MKRLIEQIFNYILDEEIIPEDLLFEFSQDTLQIVQHNNGTELTSQFWSFQNYIESFWRGEKYQHISNSFFVYQMGQLLAYTNMIRDVADEEEKRVSIEDYARRWKNRYLVFKGMHDKRGITHKSLAEYSEMSTSALSQFISKTKWDGYYTYRVMGREKHYYLTKRGEKLYDLLQEYQRDIKYEKIQFYNWYSDTNQIFNKFLGDSFPKVNDFNNVNENNLSDAEIRKNVVEEMTVKGKFSSEFSEVSRWRKQKKPLKQLSRV